MPLLFQNKHGTVALDHLTNTDACCKLSLSRASLPRKHILEVFTDLSERRLRNTYCGSKEKKGNVPIHIENILTICSCQTHYKKKEPAEKQVPEWFSKRSTEVRSDPAQS